MFHGDHIVRVAGLGIQLASIDIGHAGRVDHRIRMHLKKGTLNVGPDEQGLRVVVQGSDEFLTEQYVEAGDEYPLRSE